MVTKATSRKSKTCQWQKRWKKDRYQFVILWLWYSRCFDTLDIFTWNENWFCFIWNPCKQICVVEREAVLRFYDRPLGVLCLTTPLHLTEKLISLNLARAWNQKPEPGAIPTLISEARFRPTKQIYRVKICATAGYWWRIATWTWLSNSQLIISIEHLIAQLLQQ